MLYLEDYLEMIEHLPQELRDRFTDMREMDLTVQNNMDSFEKRIRTLFTQCRRAELQGAQADSEFVAIRKDYYKALEDADEKVQLANQMYDLVDRYLRRLDSELFKFKCELEADHNGITEILEKRSLELDGGASSGGGATHSHAASQKENRYFGLVAAAAAAASANNHHHHHQQQHTQPTSGHTTGSTRERYRPKPEKRRDSHSTGGTAVNAAPPEKRTTSNSVVMSTGPVITVTGGGGGGVANLMPTTITLAPIVPAMNMRPITPTVPLGTTSIASPSVTYTMQHIGAGNAIAAAASQAIAATQQMQQGRRTASLKASYEAIHGSASNGAHELLIGGRELGAASTLSGMQTVDRDSMMFNTQRRHKKPRYSTSHRKMSTSSNVSQSSNQSSQSAVSAAAAAAASAAMAAAAASSVAIPAVITTQSPMSSAMVMQSPHGSTHIVQQQQQQLLQQQPILVGTPDSAISLLASSSSSSASLAGADSGLMVEQTAETDWNYDPNEPRYCICNQVSYGDMVACDNEACPFEWFHYPCVGITQSPKGKWYCPKCTASMKRRGARK